MKPLATVRSYAYAGLEPERMGLGPAYATPIALKRAGINLKDIGLVELDEAFAAQVLACVKAMASDEFCKKKLGLSAKVGEIDLAKMNVNGGAIALGHPVGATGSRLVLTLAKEMKKTWRAIWTCDSLYRWRSGRSRCSRGGKIMSIQESIRIVPRGDIGFVEFDLIGEKVNKLSTPVMTRLREVVDELKGSRYKAVVLISRKTEDFHRRRGH